MTISAATHHSRSDYNLYEGTEVQGSPEVVLLRGNVLVDGDALVAKPGIGQFIKRAKFGEELTAAGYGRRPSLRSQRVCGKPRSTDEVAGSGQRDVTTFERVKKSIPSGP